MTQLYSANLPASEMSPDILLREQLHRFSNSFQIIATLARQCTRGAGASDTMRMVEALEDRLDALTTLHRLLSRSFEMRDFASHMGKIARALVRSFGRADAVSLWIDHFWLPEKHRLRLALIVNELVTNVLKHSLRNCAEGVIAISARTGGRTIVLTVSDSNRNTLDGKRPLTSPIVAELAESLGGAAEVFDENGYAVRVVLPWDERPARFAERFWPPQTVMPAASAWGPC
jgi:two-component sensor histidine kinase